MHVRALIPARWLRAARARRRHLAGLALLALSPPPLYRPRVCEQRVRISARLALAAAEPTAVAVAKPRCPSARVAARVVTSVAFFIHCASDGASYRWRSKSQEERLPREHLLRAGAARMVESGQDR